MVEIRDERLIINKIYKSNAMTATRTLNDYSHYADQIKVIDGFDGASAYTFVWKNHLKSKTQ